ncbi:MAG: hypothetical protein KKB31_00125, partial [Nanoarchaeota archaeon]|nr:hypothetical protein [Nanoarchaeota archaeon]
FGRRQNKRGADSALRRYSIVKHQAQMAGVDTSKTNAKIVRIAEMKNYYGSLMNGPEIVKELRYM